MHQNEQATADAFDALIRTLAENDPTFRAADALVSAFTPARS